MPDVNVPVECCTDCGPYFRYTADKGCFCLKESIEKMIEDETYDQFNHDFHAGELFTKVAEWCPLKNKD